MILLIDNYDGCANNIYQLVGQLNPNISIVHNDEVDVTKVRKLHPSHIILSGGSTSPENAGCSMEIVRTFAGSIPILGICLGYRIICATYGGKCVQMEEICQGKRLLVYQEQQTELFAGMPQSFYAGFYHSQTVPEENIPSCFSIIARKADEVSGIAHKTDRVFGVQFHPESFLSECGIQMMQNFLV